MERAGSDSYSDDDDVEKKGLGTPATRAAIIETLVKRQYVERKGKQLIPTDKGIRVINVVPDKVKSPAMTAEWESTLQKIARGEADDQQFLREMTEFTRQLIKDNSGETTRENNPFRFSRLPLVGKCPVCGKNVYEFQKSYSCEDSRGACGFFFMKEKFGKEITPTQAKRILYSAFVQDSQYLRPLGGGQFVAAAQFDILYPAAVQREYHHEGEGANVKSHTAAVANRGEIQPPALAGAQAHSAAVRGGCRRPVIRRGHDTGYGAVPEFHPAQLHPGVYQRRRHLLRISAVAAELHMPKPQSH